MLFWIAVLATLIGGAAGALQAKVVGNTFEKIGLIGNLFINFFIGFIIILLLLVIASLIQTQHPWRILTDMRITQTIKWWEATSGIFTMVIITSLGYAAGKLGVTGALMVFLTSQIIIGATMDHYGFLGGQTFVLTPTKVIGMAVMILGVYLFFRT